MVPVHLYLTSLRTRAESARREAGSDSGVDPWEYETAGPLVGIRADPPVEPVPAGAPVAEVRREGFARRLAHMAVASAVVGLGRGG